MECLRRVGTLARHERNHVGEVRASRLIVTHRAVAIAQQVEQPQPLLLPLARVLAPIMQLDQTIERRIERRALLLLEREAVRKRERRCQPFKVLRVALGRHLGRHREQGRLGWRAAAHRLLLRYHEGRVFYADRDRQWHRARERRVRILQASLAAIAHRRRTWPSSLLASRQGRGQQRAEQHALQVNALQVLRGLTPLTLVRGGATREDSAPVVVILLVCGGYRPARRRRRGDGDHRSHLGWLLDR